MSSSENLHRVNDLDCNYTSGLIYICAMLNATGPEAHFVCTGVERKNIRCLSEIAEVQTTFCMSGKRAFASMGSVSLQKIYEWLRSTNGS